MKEVILTMKEKNVYSIIKKLVETNGNKNRAALKIGCTLRNINLLIKKYNSLGKAGFSHGNKSRKPKSSFSLQTRNKIISLYENKYYDCNFTHFCEKLNEDEEISITYTPLRNILSEAGYISPLCFKRTRRLKKKELEAKKKLSEIDKKTIQDDHILDSINSHPRRSRSKYFGELIQMDASGGVWFGDTFATLHLAVDDSTGCVVGAYFDIQETLKGYYNVFKSILTDFGIPVKFLTDNRTVFIYNKKNNPRTEDDTLTQFGYACRCLGVEIETSSIPQRKGRIERLNGTFQRRLPQELRLAKINSIEEANNFLMSYVKKFNTRFSLQVNFTTSVFENKPSLDVINKTLAIVTPRVFDSGSSIRFENNYYQASNANSTNLICFARGTKALVIKTFDNKYFVSVDEKLYILKKLDERKKVSDTFDQPIESIKIKNQYVPPMTHPWKRQSFLNYLKTVKHRPEFSANV